MQLKTQSPLCEHCGYNENIDNLSHQLSVNTVLNGRFRLGKVLGQGGFGITYIGWDLKENVPVAVKEYYPKSVVHRNISVSPDVICTNQEGLEFFRQYRAQFLQEARLLEKFAHVPQIVHVKTVFEENNTVYMAMEHVRGTDLRMYIRMAGLLTAQQTFYILRPVMEALSKIHESGLVHKDISPDNIMILPNGQAKLLDFGAAQDLIHQTQGTTTRTALSALKHGFAPVEQYQTKGNLGPWTDVYALCATIHYCMTGKLPKPALDRIDNKELNWSSVPGLTAEQIAALNRGMEPLPADRFANVRELYEGLFPTKTQPVVALEEIVDVPVRKPEETIRKQPEPPKQPKPAKPPKEKKTADPAMKKKLAVAVAAVLVVIAAAALLMMPKGWKQEDGGRCYYRMGSRITGLQRIGSDTYWFDENGMMGTGWQKIDGKTYYFTEEGVMLRGEVTLEDVQYRFTDEGVFQYRIRSLGAWEYEAVESEDKVTFEKKNNATQSWTYQQLEKPLEECAEFTVKMELKEYKSGNVDQWGFAYRDLNGQWHVVDENIRLTNNKAFWSYKPVEPVSFDAYVWFCKSIGTMWNFERSYRMIDVMVVEYDIES